MVAGTRETNWKKGQRCVCCREPAMCMGNINMLVKCMGKPLRMESKFRKRNFNAIMKVTGACCTGLRCPWRLCASTVRRGSRRGCDVL